MKLKCSACSLVDECLPEAPRYRMAGDRHLGCVVNNKAGYWQPVASATVTAEQAHDGCRNTCCHREATAKEKERILGLIQAARSEFFHSSAAWALDKLAERVAGLPHATSDVTKQAASVEEDKAARRHASLACRGCGVVHRTQDLAEGLLCFKCCGLPHGGKDEEP